MYKIFLVLSCLAEQKSVLYEVAKFELDQLPDYVSSCNIAYLCDIGYYVMIPHTSRICPQLDNLEDYGLEFKVS